MGGWVNDLTGNKSGKVDEDKFNNPAYDDIRQRMLAIIDSYIKDKGIDALFPQDKRPYEFLSPEEQEQAREEQENPEKKTERRTEPTKIEEQNTQRAAVDAVPVKQRAEPEQQVSTPEPQSTDPLTTSAKSEQENDLLQKLRLRRNVAALERQGIDNTALPINQPQSTATYSDYIRNGTKY